MADGRIVVDLGEQRKRKFKAVLGLNGEKMNEWLKKVIDVYTKESEVKE